MIHQRNSYLSGIEPFKLKLICPVSLCVMLCNLGVQFYFSLARFNSTSYGLISLYKFAWNVISAKIQESNYIEQFNTKIQNCEAKIVPFQALTILHLQNWHQ